MSETADTLRYERKFAVETPDAYMVRVAVKRHRAMFRTLHPPRNVNNIYFDTLGLAAAHHNLEGIPERWKARLRWYGKFWGPATNAALEMKRKHGNVGGKERFPLARFEVSPAFTRAAIGEAITAADPSPTIVAALGGLEPSLANHYHREYYATPDGRFRVTIDSDLTYLAIGRRRPPLRRRRYVIVEVKYERRWDLQAHEICAEFPFRVSRFSKYAAGIALLGG